MATISSYFSSLSLSREMNIFVQKNKKNLQKIGLLSYVEGTKSFDLEFKPSKNRKYRKINISLPTHLAKNEFILNRHGRVYEIKFVDSKISTIVCYDESSIMNIIELLEKGETIFF